ncbi:hypothetical protein K438DRAFT_1797757 [Mycena galopus ATCC 62051]|nr:hypothetical protein K438DRAFT_1797757 [Mycena galopus ATCC 62051]
MDAHPCGSMPPVRICAQACALGFCPVTTVIVLPSACEWIKGTPVLQSSLSALRRHVLKTYLMSRVILRPHEIRNILLRLKSSRWMSRTPNPVPSKRGCAPKTSHPNIFLVVLRK